MSLSISANRVDALVDGGMSGAVSRAFLTTVPIAGDGRRARTWWSNAAGLSLTVWTMCVLPVEVACADQIVTHTANYPRSRLLSYEQGILRFRTAEGDVRQAWVGDVEQIVVDSLSRFTDFNDAERFLAAGEPGKALPRYERNARIAQDFWVDLIRTRLTIACDRAGRIDEATLNWIRVLRGRWTGPETAARLIPENIPAGRDEALLRAVQQVATARQTARDDEHIALLTLVEFAYRQRLGEGIPESATRAAQLFVPESIRSQRVYRILLAAFERAMETDSGVGPLDDLDRAIADCPAEMLPSLLLLKGRTLLRHAATDEEVIRAAWVLMRVPIHMPNDPRAAEGLLRAAAAMERLGRREKAERLLAEALSHPQAAPEVRKEAEAARKRLRD